MDNLLDSMTEATDGLGEIGAGVVKAGASLVGTVLLAGITIVGLGKMLEGFRD